MSYIYFFKKNPWKNENFFPIFFVTFASLKKFNWKAEIWSFLSCTTFSPTFNRITKFTDKKEQYFQLLLDNGISNTAIAKSSNHFNQNLRLWDKKNSRGHTWSNRLLKYIFSKNKKFRFLGSVIFKSPRKGPKMV